MVSDAVLEDQLCRVSLIEIVLIRGGSRLLRRFFETWPAPSIYLFAMTNFLTWNVTKEYLSSRWNIRRTLEKWFTDAGEFLTVLEETNAVVCGPLVSHFFNRTPHRSRTMDICTSTRGFRQIALFLSSELYRAPPIFDFSTSFLPDGDHRVRTFLLRRIANKQRKVAVHVVQGDPMSFLATCASCMYTSTIVLFRRLIPLASRCHKRYQVEKSNLYFSVGYFRLQEVHPKSPEKIRIRRTYSHSTCGTTHRTP